MSSILLIVEGPDESKLFNKLKEIYNIDAQIFPVRSNIYHLYNTLKEYDFNGDIKTILREFKSISEKEKELLKENFTYTYLVYDCDIQNTKKEEKDDPTIPYKNLDILVEMSEYFKDETDPTIGKLYINFPMIESYRDCDSFFDENYKNNTIELTNIKKYKEICGKKKLCRFHLDDYTKDNFCDLIRMNVYKLNQLINNELKVPQYRNYLEISPTKKVMSAEKEMIEKIGKISVLNTSLFFTLDYFGNKNNFYDQVCKLNYSFS